MQRFAVLVLSSAVHVSAGEDEHDHGHGQMEEMARQLPSTGLDLIPSEKYGKDQPFWTKARYGVDSVTDEEGNTKDTFHWSTQMFANPEMSAEAKGFEGYQFASIMSFGNSEGESPVMVDGYKTEKKTLNKPTKTQNVYCSIKYHHVKDDAEKEEEHGSDGCTESGDMHCNLKVTDTDFVTFGQWCSNKMNGEWPALPVHNKNFKGAKAPTNAVACAPWALSTLDKTSKDGLHMHMADAKIYARCSIKQDFEVNDKAMGAVKNFQKCALDTDYWVFGSTAVYNTDKKMVDTRNSGWKKMRVQREAGANFNAVVSFAGIVAGAALLSF